MKVNEGFFARCCKYCDSSPCTLLKSYDYPTIQVCRGCMVKLQETLVALGLTVPNMFYIDYAALARISPRAYDCQLPHEEAQDESHY